MPLARDILVDVGSVENKEALHRVVADAFGFPDYYGKNWDAFWDCISSLESAPQSIRITGFEKLEAHLPREAPLMKRCLLDYEDQVGEGRTKLYWG